MKLKQGVWVNRTKMRRALDKISMYYGILLTAYGTFSIIGKSYLVGTLFIGLGIPLLIIQFSYIQFMKGETKICRKPNKRCRNKKYRYDTRILG